MNKPTADSVAREIAFEFSQARANHAPMNGPHEGWAVIFEEVDELWDLVKLNPRKAYTDQPGKTAGQQHRQLMRAEAIQVAAMAMAFVLEVCE